MKNIKFLFIVAIVFLNCTSSNAMNGNLMSEMCFGNEISQLNCDYYIDGLFDQDQNYRQLLTLDNSLWYDKVRDNHCIPLDVSYNQIEKVIRNYLLYNPENLHLDMSVIYFKAMKNSFPCK